MFHQKLRHNPPIGQPSVVEACSHFSCMEHSSHHAQRIRQLSTESEQVSNQLIGASNRRRGSYMMGIVACFPCEEGNQNELQVMEVSPYSTGIRWRAPTESIINPVMLLAYHESKRAPCPIWAVVSIILRRDVWSLIMDEPHGLMRKFQRRGYQISYRKRDSLRGNTYQCKRSW